MITRVMILIKMRWNYDDKDNEADEDVKGIVHHFKNYG